MSADPSYGHTMCLEQASGLLVVVHTSEPPARDEWTRYCKLARALRNARGELRTLAVAAKITAGPNASQRAEYNASVQRERTRVAVLCDSFAGRTALTALSWFNPNMRAFDAGRLDQALAYLDAVESPEIVAAIERMHRHMKDHPRSRGDVAMKR